MCALKQRNRVTVSKKITQNPTAHLHVLVHDSVSLLSLSTEKGLTLQETSIPYSTVPECVSKL